MILTDWIFSPYGDMEIDFVNSPASSLKGEPRSVNR